MTPEAQSLLDRMEKGEILRSTLEILAGLDHRPASEALGREPVREPWHELVMRFTESDPLVRAVLASARVVLPLDKEAARLQDAFLAFEAWLDDPTPRKKRDRDRALGPTPESDSHCGVTQPGQVDLDDVHSAIVGVYFSRYTSGDMKQMKSQARSSIQAAPSSS